MPNHEDLVELYRREKNPKLKERYQALCLMKELENCTKVARVIKKSRTTIQTRVKLFNSGRMVALVPRFPLGCPSRLIKE
ncbi:MAG: hypothetical protein ACTSVV_07635 [Promethearchaeota archaeon]